MSATRGTILIVDDNRVNRLLLARAVEDLGFSAAYAEDGAKALEMMRTCPCDVVLLDVLMPGLNGYAVLSEMKGDRHLGNIPVIMVSSVEELDSVIRCIELGAEDYLNKPINPVLLKARINSSIEKKKFRDWQGDMIGKFATEEVAEELLTRGFSLDGKVVRATALFCDIRSFTTIAESLSPSETIELLNDYYALMMDAIMNAHGIVNQLIGDGLFAIFGAPVPRQDGAACAVRAARQMVQLMEQYSSDTPRRTSMPIHIGIGIASGEMIAGFTGTQRRAIYTCIGDTVNLASRLESHTKVVGKPILIDAETRGGLDSTFVLVDEGAISLRGKTRDVHVFSVPAAADQSCPDGSSAS
jgi:class 3 adenylate cyclase